MNEQLLLRNIRAILARLEETILFGFIERAQFKRNAIVYRSGAFGSVARHDNLTGYLLHETEKIHARMRRYTSPDEHPFYRGLPGPVLPRLRFDESPLRPNSVNINDDIRRVYEKKIVPMICLPGDDRQYGSSAVCDVQLLQALSRRIHFGKFVAESKYRVAPARFDPLIKAGDAAGLMRSITDRRVEADVLDRVRRKARTYGRGLGTGQLSEAVAVRIYRDWIIPLNKRVQVLYLLARR